MEFTNFTQNFNLFFLLDIPSNKIYKISDHSLMLILILSNLQFFWIPNILND